MGCDEVDYDKFAGHLDDNLYRTWNRLRSGTCFPAPVLEVDIPKKNGKMRKLGVSTIGGRAAQAVARISFIRWSNQNSRKTPMASGRGSLP